MKNVITIVACVLILAVFLTQITVSEITHTKLVYSEEVVNTAMQQVRQKGYLPQALEDDIKEKISEKTGCEKDEVTVSCSGSAATPMQRGELIEYTVEYSVKGVIGAAKALGFTEAENKMRKVITGAVVSEYVGP